MLSKTKSCGDPSTALINEIRSLIWISFVEIFKSSIENWLFIKDFNEILLITSLKFRLLSSSNILGFFAEILILKFSGLINN